jgi:hypothetical protein
VAIATHLNAKPLQRQAFDFIDKILVRARLGPDHPSLVVKCRGQTHAGLREAGRPDTPRAPARCPGRGGVSWVRAWANVRAAASRPVSGSPNAQASRNVAIKEVWRCSWLKTSPSATYGET